ncbi:PDZ domain-containing protein [candidate division KSB1 bacterium]|nr:PDZ domain-containing protein [candidate division KSB1 bacterium]
MRLFLKFMLCFFVLSSQFLLGQETTRLLRFPTIYNDQLVFSYAGDLYSVNAAGGVARRLTADDGYEIFPRFSPDGKYLAFTGQYDGNTEVYLMPATGGVPKRLTFTATLGRDDVSDRMGPNNLVMGWEAGKADPAKAQIIFRSRMREFNSFKGQLYAVGIDGSLPEQLPFSRGGFCSYAPDSKKIAYNRIFREFRTWKRYRGGMADDIWIFDFATQKSVNITNNPTLDIIPMWSGQQIYFLSDRDASQRMNLWCYHLETKITRQLTQFTEFDIKFPALGNVAIVFENGGDIYRFDLATEKVEKVPIDILEDQIGARNELVEVQQNIQNYEISPDGKRALFGARGEIFTVPAKYGPTRNLTNSSGVHERNSKWSPDGKWIAYISDQSGEDEIYLTAATGKEAPVQLTTQGEAYKYQLSWSPDSRKLLWADRQQRLRYLDIQEKTIHEVAQARAWEFNDYTWSPDSKWIAYTFPEAEMLNKIYLYSLEKKLAQPVTDGWYAVSEPTFSPDGKYLLLVSERDFNPIYSATEWNHAYLDLERIYLITLAKDIPSPFKPRSDEAEIKTEPAKATKKTDGEKGDKSEVTEKKEPVVVKVDWDGILQRQLALPIKAANYRGLTVVGDQVYYLRRAHRDEKTLLLVYDLKEQKETELGAINGYEISADQKKMLVSQDQTYAIIDLPKAKIEIKEKLDLSGLVMQLDHRQEWQQIYHECWRQMRDFFYAPNMHGVNWEKMRDKYAPLLKYVNHRADLTYLIGELIGELSAGHTYVGGGEMPRPKRIQTGLLGAQLVRDPASQYYQIKKILRGQNWNNTLRSPLTEIGVNASEGDFILAINGVPTNQMPNIYAALVNTVNKQVTLTLNAQASLTGSREVVVVPIADEAELYYFNWVQQNIEKVSQATNGKVGYLHVPDMSTGGLNEFVKYFYPQLRKKALIIDVRGNGGGNVSPMLIERLRREIAMIDIARNTIPTPDPGAMIYGPKICLLDEFSASDGDLFPYRFQTYKLGKLIGKRSWGGVVGIRGSLPLLDGGYLNKPEFASFDPTGKAWIIEGHGVEPDIEVENDPALEFLGQDAQLDRAILEILTELKTQEKTLPPPPPYPVK